MVGGLWVYFLLKLIIGADITGVALDDAGKVLSDTVRQYMSEMEVDDGLQALGYTTEDIPALVQGTLPQVCTHYTVHKYITNKPSVLYNHTYLCL